MRELAQADGSPPIARTASPGNAKLSQLQLTNATTPTWPYQAARIRVPAFRPSRPTAHSCLTGEKGAERR